MFSQQKAALAKRTNSIKDCLSRVNISGYSRLAGCKRTATISKYELPTSSKFRRALRPIMSVELYV